MNILSKLSQEIGRQFPEHYGWYNLRAKSKYISEIEKLIFDPIPLYIKKLYLYADGQSQDAPGILFGLYFLSTDQISAIIKDQIKGNGWGDAGDASFGSKIIKNPELSENLIKQIVTFHERIIDKHKLLASNKTWYKAEFSVQANCRAFLLPRVFEDKETEFSKSEILPLGIENYGLIIPLIKELYEEERATFYWDRLDFVLFSDGEYEVERTTVAEKILSSIPKDAIKKRWLHIKWLPLFVERTILGNNYIAVDLDPDINGKKGQVIVFGNNQYKLLVLADSLEEFFHLILIELRKPNNRFKNSEKHIFAILQEVCKK